MWRAFTLALRRSQAQLKLVLKVNTTAKSLATFNWTSLLSVFTSPKALFFTETLSYLEQNRDNIIAAPKLPVHSVC